VYIEEGSGFAAVTKERTRSSNPPRKILDQGSDRSGGQVLLAWLEQLAGQPAYKDASDSGNDPADGVHRARERDDRGEPRSNDQQDEKLNMKPAERP
jgi:hypothetical protein